MYTSLFPPAIRAGCDRYDSGVNRYPGQNIRTSSLAGANKTAAKFALFQSSATLDLCTHQDNPGCVSRRRLTRSFVQGVFCPQQLARGPVLTSPSGPLRSHGRLRYTSSGNVPQQRVAIGFGCSYSRSRPFFKSQRKSEYFKRFAELATPFFSCSRSSRRTAPKPTYSQSTSVI